MRGGVLRRIGVTDVHAEQEPGQGGGWPLRQAGHLGVRRLLADASDYHGEQEHGESRPSRRPRRAERRASVLSSLLDGADGLGEGPGTGPGLPCDQAARYAAAASAWSSVAS